MTARLRRVRCAGGTRYETRAPREVCGPVALYRVNASGRRALLARVILDRTERGVVILRVTRMPGARLPPWKVAASLLLGRDLPVRLRPE